MVYAINDACSFREVDWFYEIVVREKGVTKIPLVICGNNCTWKTNGLCQNKSEKNLQSASKHHSLKPPPLHT